MNSFERIESTIKGDPLDRRAFIPILSLYGARMTSCSIKKFYSDPEAYTAGQMAVYDEFKPDMLFGPFAFALIGAAFGSELKFSEFEAPNIKRPGVLSFAQWEKMALPDIDTNPYLLYFRESIRLISIACEGKVQIAACLPAPIDIPALVFGMDRWLELVLFESEQAELVLDKVNRFFVQLANCLFDEGAMVTFLPCGYASPAILPRNLVESLLRPKLRQALGQLKGPSILHHAGTIMLDHLDILTGLPSAIGYALLHTEGLSKARQILGPDPILLSGPHGPSLDQLESSQIEQISRSILEDRDREKDRHFILVTLGADVLYHTPPENLHAMRKALADVGWNAS